MSYKFNPISGQLDYYEDTTPVKIALTCSTTTSTNLSLGDIFTVTLTGNTILGNPTNPIDAENYVWFIKQDGSGNRTVTLGNKFSIPSSATTPLPFSTGSNQMDMLCVVADTSADKFYVVSFIPGY
jgi:hypothetical protein